jgi:hypothetical protein
MLDIGEARYCLRLYTSTSSRDISITLVLLLAGSSQLEE